MAKFWTTKNGRRIAVHKLDDSHLLNIIALLERKARSTVNTMPFPMFHGEMAQFYSEERYDSLHECPSQILSGTIYDELKKEAEKRGLKGGNYE